MAELKEDVVKEIEEVRSKYGKNILFYIARSKNKNIVVYEALMDKDDSKQLSKTKPIDVYWLDIDPSYVEKKRAKGIQSDREELNMIENNMAYGLSFEPVQGKQGTYLVKLVALPERAVTLYIDEKGQQTATLSINGEQATVLKIYVHSKDNFFGLPTVYHVDVYGLDKNGKPVHERIVYKK